MADVIHHQPPPFYESKKSTGLRAYFRQMVAGFRERLNGLSTAFNKRAASTPVIPFSKQRLSDDALMDLVQRQTLRYFWEFGHPVNGMARERCNLSAYTFYDANETVTTGGTGFGIMAMLAGAERGWLKRGDVMERLNKIVSFLEKVETHHGVFPHFVDSRTGKSNHFVPSENGGNLVETAFLMMGMLGARQYFSGNDTDERALRSKINALWQALDWSSHKPPGDNNLKWLNHPESGLGHWPVTGWNEAVVTHILAAASPMHAVSPAVYKEGWASGQDFYKNGETYHGIELPLGPAMGGPLFFSHYSFLGIDPRGLKDVHADYWQQNVNHTRINWAHCVANQFGHKGYGPECWGLTASDSPTGYMVHSPTTDLGVIAPTAALSAMPYTPEESMRALRHFYEDRGDKIWGEYGFYDAFCENEDWCSKSYLAIDQAPIVVMIENHRTGLLWNLFMSCPEVKMALQKLGFESPHLTPLKPETANMPAQPRVPVPA